MTSPMLRFLACIAHLLGPIASAAEIAGFVRIEIPELPTIGGGQYEMRRMMETSRSMRG